MDQIKKVLNRYLDVVLAMTGVALLYIYLQLAGDHWLTPTGGFFVGFCFLLLGSMGLVMIVRKSFGYYARRIGRRAVILGWIILIFWWGAAFMTFYRTALIILE